MEATYEQLPLACLCGNPLTEALHFLYKPEYIAQALAENSRWCPENFWELPTSFKMTAINSIDRVHVPAPQLATLYDKIVSLLFESYSHR